MTATFPGTLSPAVAPLEWTGYPPATEGKWGLPYDACAVAHLGTADGVHGWWLHHTTRGDAYDGARHVLTLIAPCKCGTYLTVRVPDEPTLTAMLDELDTAPGAPIPCDHRLRIRTESYADPAHLDVEPPF